MVSAIQTAASVYIASQPVRLAAVSQLANQAQSPQLLSGTIVSLGATKVVPVTYNASGLLDTLNSIRSATVTQSTSTPASVLTVNADQNAASILRAADMEASTIAENLAVLDTALADSLAKQLLINTRTIAAGLAQRDAALSSTNASLAATANSIETSRQVEIARQAIANNSARTLDNLPSASVSQSTTEQVANASQDAVAITNSAATLPLLTPSLQSVREVSSTVASTTPATTSNVVVATNTTTNNLSNTSAVATSLVGNPTFAAVVQAIPSVPQNPANANLAAENNTSVNASSVPSPVTVTPTTPQEATAASAISPITNLAQPVAITSKDNVVKTDSAATLRLVTPSLQSITVEPGVVTNTTPATATNVVAATNATTNSLSSTAEVANLPVVNPQIDSGVQAVTTIAQNPAYANLVAGNYVSMAATSAQSPSVAGTPTRLEDIKPVIAIPAITALSQLGAHSGRDGNPASGYRQRGGISNTQLRRALNTI